MAAPETNQSQDGAQAGGQKPRGAARFFGRRPNLQTPTEALHPETPPPPPLTPNSQKRPMLSAASGILSFLLIVAIIGIGMLAYVSSRLTEPGPLKSEKVVFIAPRTEVSDIIDQLEKAGVVDQPTVLKAFLVIDRKWSRVKAGEYLFKEHASLNEVIETLVSGREVLHSVTIPEGLTSEQIVERLRQNDLLTGEIVEIPPEGTLLPETYRVRRGQARASVVRLMRDQQTRVLDQIWERRSPELPVRSKMELLTMASIVEKETGRSDERTRVASVFYNRLRRGIKLQSDPTIVYGLVGGKGTLGRPIQKDEIVRATRYNTYVIPALPPGPIANPGRASLEAAANPSRTNDLFFVANGTGGHTFAESLDQHNRNVVRWREIERDRAAQRASQPAAGGTAAPDLNQANDRVAPGAEPDANAASPNRGRRSDLPGGEVFGEVPAVITGKTVAVADLGRALKAAPTMPAPAPQHAAAAAPAALPSAPAPVAAPAPGITNMGLLAYASDRPTPTLAAVVPSLPPGLSKKPVVVGASPASPDAKPSTAPASPAAEAPDAATRFKLGKGLKELGIQIAGVDPAPSLLDGPADESGPVGQANLETYPVEASRKSDMNARSAMYGRGVVPTGPVETLTLQDNEAAAAAVAARPQVRRILDASEGTSLDPLKSKGWDLNAAHNVPAPVPVSAVARKR